MRAMILKKFAAIDQAPLELVDIPVPEPGPEEILLQVKVCGVCHTDLHTVEGELHWGLSGNKESRLLDSTKATGWAWPGFIRPAASADSARRGMKTYVRGPCLQEWMSTAVMPST